MQEELLKQCLPGKICHRQGKCCHQKTSNRKLNNLCHWITDKWKMQYLLVGYLQLPSILLHFLVGRIEPPMPSISLWRLAHRHHWLPHQFLLVSTDQLNLCTSTLSNGDNPILINMCGELLPGYISQSGFSLQRYFAMTMDSVKTSPLSSWTVGIWCFS